MFWGSQSCFTSEAPAVLGNSTFYLRVMNNVFIILMLLRSFKFKNTKLGKFSNETSRSALML